MPKLIYRDGPPSVGLVVSKITGKDKKTGKPIFDEGDTVIVQRGKPSPDLPDHVVESRLNARPQMVVWEVFKEPKPKVTAAKKAGGDS